MINVAITDDHPIVIEGIRNILSATDYIQLVAGYQNATETLISGNLREIHILLLDINLPDKDGITLCSELIGIYSHLKIIGLTSHVETIFMKKMIRAGARGYLLKSASAKTVVDAISQVYQGKEFIQLEMKELLVNESLYENRRFLDEVKLTRREKEILTFIAEEFTTQQIADKLLLSSKTVETHRQNLMLKLGVKRTAGLMKIAIERGLL